MNGQRYIKKECTRTDIYNFLPLKFHILVVIGLVLATYFTYFPFVFAAATGVEKRIEFEGNVGSLQVMVPIWWL